jgi:hypothetical protein
MIVKSLNEIAHLYLKAEGGDEDMPNWKRTEERMDKAIQFIWNYQRLHGGNTPRMVTIGQNIGIKDWKTGTTYFITKLVDEGRLDKISSQPFRATINMSHPKNRSAIHRFQRLLEKQEQAEADERQDIRERQETERILANRQEVFAAASAELEDGPAIRIHDHGPRTPAPGPDREAGGQQLIPRSEAQRNGETIDSILRFNEARTSLRDAEKVIRQAMPQMIKVAATRDLLNELVERGYVVSRR